MSRKGFIVRTLALVEVSVVAGSVLLFLSAIVLLDLGTETRQDEFLKMLIYVLGASVLMNGLIFAQLRSVLLLLRLWDQDQVPDASVVQRAQTQALLFPNRLVLQTAAIALGLVVAATFVDVLWSHYQLELVLVNAALAFSFVLGIGFAINIGLRALVHPILARISSPPRASLGRFSVQSQMTLSTVLLVGVILVFVTALIYSYVIKAVDEIVAQERLRWMKETLLPPMREWDEFKWPSYLALRAARDTELFLLDASGEYVQHTPRYDLRFEERQKLSRMTQPQFYKRDYSTLRVVVFPLEQGYVLCQVFQSGASQTQTVRTMVRTLGVGVIIVLVLAVGVSGMTSQSLARTVRDVTVRLEALADQEQTTQYEVVAQTSLDEVGDLVQALNRIQRRAAVFTAQLQSSMRELESASVKQQRLLETMVGLTAPVIPVAPGLVVVVLSGYFDRERAAYIRPNLLKGVTDSRAQVAIIDLTAVAEVSEPLTEQLYRAVKSVGLMGCQVILTGASSDVAWALTQAKKLDVLQTQRDLEDALAFAYRQLAMN